GRCEQSFIARALEQLAKFRLIGLRDERIDVFFGERLPCERRRLRGKGLGGGGPLAGDIGLRNGSFFDRPQRLAGEPIEDEHRSELGALRHGLDRFAIVFDREEFRGDWQVVVPEVVVNDLEMPEALAGARVERQQRIAEEVVALAIGTIEVEAWSAERNERDAMFRVDGHFAPTMDAANGLPRVGRPGVVTGFPGVRDRVELPDQLPCANVVRMDIGRVRVVAGASRGQWDNHQIFEDTAGVAGLERAGRVAVESYAEVAAPVAAEAFDRLAGTGVDSREIPAVDIEQAAVGAVGAFPVIGAARADRTRIGVGPE